jgi:hypothetical protein
MIAGSASGASWVFVSQDVESALNHQSRPGAQVELVQQIADPIACVVARCGFGGQSHLVQQVCDEVYVVARDDGDFVRIDLNCHSFSPRPV